MDKSAGIADALSHLRRRLGSAAFHVIDYWPEDPDTIGIAPPGGEEPCVSILTAGKAAGRFDVEFAGKVFRDCVIEGVVWAVRHELGRAAELNVPSTALCRIG
jgi:hypothetical protein